MIFVQKWGWALVGGVIGWLLMRRFVLPALFGLTLAVGACTWVESDYDLAKEAWDELTVSERASICQMWRANPGGAEASLWRTFTSPPDPLSDGEAEAAIRVVRDECR